MKLNRIAALAASMALLAGAVDARTLKLKPAKPQPSSVSAGLGVNYAYPKDVKSNRDAYVALGIKSEKGKPLTAGLDYLSSDDDPNALTSKKEHKVAASINGYIKFEAAGTYKLQTFSNDGLDLKIGGQQIAKVDKKRGCDPIGAVEVSVPSAGWYKVEGLYWQRKGSSCLILEWSQNGSELDVVPAKLFGH